MVEVVASVKVKFLSVEAVPPVYCSVPPPKTKLAAALVEAPIPLFEPPLAIDEILNVPTLIVVAPV